MRTSSAARQFVTYPTPTTLLIVGVLLLTSAVPLYAEPAAMQPVNSFAASCGANSAPREGFLVATLAAPTRYAGPRLTVTQEAVRGVVALQSTRTIAQTQAASKPRKSWIGRNWWWFVPTVAVVGYTALYCAANCND